MKAAVCALALLAAMAAQPGAVMALPGGPADPARAMPADPGPPLEHLRGVYLQEGIEFATVGGTLVRLTRFTRFARCRGRRPLAEELNEHTVEVLGRQVPGVGFVAGVVIPVEACAIPPAAGPGREAGDR